MTPRKFLGISLLIISCLAWAVLPVVPFLPLDGEQKMAWGGGLLIFAEILWWISMPLLGPEIKTLLVKWWAEIKRFAKFGNKAVAPESIDLEDS